MDSYYNSLGEGYAHARARAHTHTHIHTYIYIHTNFADKTIFKKPGVCWVQKSVIGNKDSGFYTDKYSNKTRLVTLKIIELITGRKYGMVHKYFLTCSQAFMLILHLVRLAMLQIACDTCMVTSFMKLSPRSHSVYLWS